jgi:hypothetical protein
MNKNSYDELNLKKFKMKSILPDATVLLLGKRRSGKCLLKGTKVLMFNGESKCVENIKKGDLVMGDDSTCRTVLDTHHGMDTMYKITNQYNESYTVNSQHILSLICTFLPNFKEKEKYYKIKYFHSTKCVIATKTFYYDNSNKDTVYQTAKSFVQAECNKIMNIPICQYLQLQKKYKKFLYGYQKPVHFHHTETLIDPYLYGLLFDNHYKYTKNPKILKYLSKILPYYNSYLYYDPVFGVYQIEGELSLTNKLSGKLSRVYTINSIKQRLFLLLGILNINDYFKNGCYIVHKNDSHNLNDILFLIKSLGFSVYKFSETDYIKIFIACGDLLLKKSDFLKACTPNYILNHINIECVGIQQYYGFQVDNNSLFMLDNCIVTHNSWLVRDIFYHHKHIPSGVVFSGTEEANPFFGDFIPDCFIHSEYDPELIEKIMNKQKRKIKDAKNTGSKDGKCPSNNLFIVFDDMLHDAQNWKNDKTVKNIFFNGRHYNFLFILTMQYPLGITPALRSNIDYVFIFNEPSVKNRRKIYEDYAAMLPSFDHFCNILDACTQNHECLVIKTSGNSSDLRNIVFWYKAESHEDFKVGHEKFWKFHNQHYNKNYENDNQDVDEKVNELKEKFARTKKLKVIVSRQDDQIVDLDYSKD